MAADIFASSPEIDLRKKWAMMQLQNAGDASPVRHPLQAVARALQGAMGGYAANQAEEADKAAGDALFKSLPGVGGGQPMPPPQAAPMGNPPPSNYAPQLANAESKYGVSPQYLARTIQIESKGNPNAINPTSGAVGLTQFVPGTWKQYGQGASPTDPNANIDAAARLTSDNMAAFKNATGRDPSFGESYLAHQQGVGGATALLQNPNAPAVDVLTKVYGGNRARAMQAITTNGGSPLETAGQFAQRWTSKFEQPQQPYQVAQAGGGGMQPTPGAQVAQAAPSQGQPPQPGGFNAPVGNRSSVQIPLDVQQTIQRLGADPRTRPQAMQLYMQYAKPVDQWQQYTAPDGTMLQKNTVTGEVKAAGTENQAITELQYAQKNWQQLGLPDPNSTDPKSRDFWQAQSAKRLGGSGVNVSLSTEKKGQEELATKGIGAYTDAQFAAREAQKRIGIYDRMEKAAESFKPGATAEIRLTGQRWLKDLGIPVDPNVPEGEVLKMLSQQLAIHAQPKGQGAVSNFEREMFSKSLPNMTQSPEGFKSAVGISRSLEQFDANVAKIYRDSAREHGGIPNYLDVQDKIAALGSPLSDKQMQVISSGAQPATAQPAASGDPIEAEMRRRNLLK